MFENAIRAAIAAFPWQTTKNIVRVYFDAWAKSTVVVEFADGDEYYYST